MLLRLRETFSLFQLCGIVIHVIEQSLVVAYRLYHKVEVLVALVKIFAHPALPYFWPGCGPQTGWVQDPGNTENRTASQKTEAQHATIDCPRRKYPSEKEIELELVVISLLGQVLKNLHMLPVGLESLNELLHYMMLLFVLYREDNTDRLGLIVRDVDTCSSVFLEERVRLDLE